MKDFKVSDDEQMIKRIFKEADRDNNDKIDYLEFKKLMTEKIKIPPRSVLPCIVPKPVD